MLKTALCSAFLKEVVPPLDPPLVECLEEFHRVVIGAFGQIVDPETENDISTFEEMFMGAMRTHDTKSACACPTCTRIYAPYRKSTRAYF